MRVAGQSVQTAQLVQLVFRRAGRGRSARCRAPARRGPSTRRRCRSLGALVEIAHLVQEQPAHDLERAEAGADVAGPRAGDHVERVDARQRRKRARPGDVRDVARRAGGWNSSTGTNCSSSDSPWSVCKSPMSDPSIVRHRRLRLQLRSRPAAIRRLRTAGSCTAPSANSRSATIQSYGSLMSKPS